LIIARSKTISAKILIVDDEEMILELMAETLTDTGYECFVANNVDAAVEVVKTTPGIVLIVTDLKMPGKTGADLIKIVEAECEQEIKFIVMSGHGSPKIEENGVDIASYPFLRKPLGIENLIEKVGSVLETKG
jgi:DNA-binding NtrC family response regulator